MPDSREAYESKSMKTQVNYIYYEVGIGEYAYRRNILDYQNQAPNSNLANENHATIDDRLIIYQEQEDYYKSLYEKEAAELSCYQSSKAFSLL